MQRNLLGLYGPVAGAAIGQFLSVEEQTAVHASIPVLMQDYQMSDVRFFGKILGVEKDYLICLGYKAGHHGQHTSAFFSTDGAKWALMPVLSDEDRHFCGKIGGLFLGKPDFDYIMDDDLAPPPAPKKPKAAADGEEGQEQQEQEEEPEEEAAAWPPKRKVFELTRLSYVLERLLADTSVVPRGAFVLNSVEEIVPNKIFNGLSQQDAGKLLSYLHARPPRTEAKKSLLEREHLVHSLDFFDSLADDVPHGCWAVQNDDATGTVLLKSLYWPGYVGFHVPESTVYGALYVGNGQRNNDLGFML